MCLVRMKVEHEEDETPSPPRRIVIRPVSQHGSDRIVVATTSRPVSRAPSHRSSQRSSRIISIIDPAVVSSSSSSRPANYILSHTISAPSAVTSAAARTYEYRRSSGNNASIPRIIHAAPSPPRSPRISNSSPRVSHTSVHSSRHSGSRRNSISGAGGGTSPRGSRTRIVSENGEIVYVSTERERGSTSQTDVLRRRSERASRGSSGQFLTTAAAAMAMTGAGTTHYRDRDDDGGYVEPAARQNIFLDEQRSSGSGGARIRSRSITYASTGNARLSRERVLVEEGGRRREVYQVVGGR